MPTGQRLNIIRKTGSFMNKYYVIIRYEQPPRPLLISESLEIEAHNRTEAEEMAKHHGTHRGYRKITVLQCIRHKPLAIIKYQIVKRPLFVERKR